MGRNGTGEALPAGRGMPASCCFEPWPVPLGYLQQDFYGRPGRSVARTLPAWRVSGACIKTLCRVRVCRLPGRGSSEPASRKLCRPRTTGQSSPGQTLCVTNASAAHHAVLHICSVCRVVAAWQQGVLCIRDRGTARYGVEASAAWHLADQTATRPTQLCVQDCGSAPAGSLADH